MESLNIGQIKLSLFATPASTSKHTKFIMATKKNFTETPQSASTTRAMTHTAHPTRVIRHTDSHSETVQFPSSSRTPSTTTPAKSVAKSVYCGRRMCTKEEDFHSDEDCPRREAVCDICERYYGSNGLHGHFTDECGYKCTYPGCIRLDPHSREECPSYCRICRIRGHLASDCNKRCTRKMCEVEGLACHSNDECQRVEAICLICEQGSSHYTEECGLGCGKTKCLDAEEYHYKEECPLKDLKCDNCYQTGDHATTDCKKMCMRKTCQRLGDFHLENDCPRNDAYCTFCQGKKGHRSSECQLKPQKNNVRHGKRW